jgi:hypothetical protein
MRRVAVDANQGRTVGENRSQKFVIGGMTGGEKDNSVGFLAHFLEGGCFGFGVSAGVDIG